VSQLFTSKVTIIGLGSQGLAWALNLRDSGFDVNVWLRTNSSSLETAKSLELSVSSEFSSIILLLIPDGQHKAFLTENSDQITEGSAIIYAHGASCIENDFSKLFPKFNHLLLAPKAIASEVRFQFEVGGKLGACSSLEYALGHDIDACKILLKNLAEGIGITAGPYPTSFKNEARADLFSEQSLLCGLLPYAAKKSFDLLISKGIDPEVAYMECWLEVKLIATAMVELGPRDFFDLISPHALSGGHKAQGMIFDKAYQNVLEKLYQDIENGTFFNEVKAQDQTKLRNDILKYWEDSQLQKVHDQLSEDLV
jgi:ketol-acid reductoisomerase